MTKEYRCKSFSKMLMKLATGVNFNNIFHANFLYKRALLCFSLVTFLLWIFFGKKYRAKGAPKMLMKLTSGDNMKVNTSIIFECDVTKYVIKREITSLIKTTNPHQISRSVRSVDSGMLKSRTLLNRKMKIEKKIF